MAARLATIEDVVGPLDAAPTDRSGVAPEFRGLATGVIETWLEIAAQFVRSGGPAGAALSHAHALITAHLLEVHVGEDGEGGTGGTGPVASESLGPASVSYATVASSSLSPEGLSGSAYGRLYEAMRLTWRPKVAAIAINSRARRFTRWR